MLDYKIDEGSSVSLDEKPPPEPEKNKHFDTFIESDKFDEYSTAFNFIFSEIRQDQLNNEQNFKYKEPTFQRALLEKYRHCQELKFDIQKENIRLDINPTIRLLKRTILLFTKAEIFEDEYQNALLEIAKCKLDQFEEFPSDIESKKFGIKILTKLASFRNDLRDQLFADDYLFHFCKHQIEGNEVFDFMDFTYDLTLYAKFYLALVQNNPNPLPPIYFDFCAFLMDQYDSDYCQKDYDEYHTPRLPLLKSLCALIKSSYTSGMEALERDLLCSLITKVHSQEFEAIPIFMSQLIKEEILCILDIFTFLIDNDNSNYLLDKGLIKWLLYLSNENQCFVCQSKTNKVFRAFTNLICKLSLVNPNCFAEDDYIKRVFDIIGSIPPDCKFDYKPFMFRLCYIFLCCAPKEVFSQMIVHDFHLIFLDDIKMGLQFEDEMEQMLRAIIRLFDYFEPYQLTQLFDFEELAEFFDESNYGQNCGILIDSINKKIKELTDDTE